MGTFKVASIVLAVALSVGCISASGPWGKVDTALTPDDIDIDLSFPWKSGVCKWGWTRKVGAVFGVKCVDDSPEAEVVPAGD